MNKSKQKRHFHCILPVWVRVVIAVLVLGAIGAFAWQVAQANVATLPAEISVARAAQDQGQGAFILDVREPSEWQQFHIAGATLIPLGELQSRLSEVPTDVEVIVVCRTGHRSAEGRDILEAAGFDNVTSMAGGVTEWQAQGFPVVSGS